MNKRTQPTTLALLSTAMLAITLLPGSHLQAVQPQRHDLAKRASEIDPHAREHPEIKFTFTDDKGKPADLQHAVVDTRVPSQGKLVIWLMGHNQGLFERISSYGYHGTLARPATIPRARVAETRQKGIAYHYPYPSPPVDTVLNQSV